MTMLAKISANAGNRSAGLAGIALMLLAVWLFSFGDAVGKYIVATYSVGQLLLLRGLGSMILLSPLIWRNRSQFTRIRRPGLQLLRVVLSTAEVAAFFAASIYLPLADIITYYLAAPIFVTAGAAFFLGERVGWRRWVAIAIGFSDSISSRVRAASNLGSVESITTKNRSFGWRCGWLMLPGSQRSRTT